MNDYPTIVVSKGSDNLVVPVSRLVGLAKVDLNTGYDMTLLKFRAYGDNRLLLRASTHSCATWTDTALSGCSFYLNKEYEWKLVKDSANNLLLVPLKPE